MIQTKEFKIPNAEFFKFSLLLQLRKSWLLLVGILFTALLSYSDFDNSPVSKFVFIFCCIYPLLYLLLIYNSAYSAKNDFILSTRCLNIDSYKITAIFKEETSPGRVTISEFPINKILKKIRFKRYWILVIVKNAYIYIPISSFKNEEDQIEFEKNITSVPFY
jgi:hypothetical protein